MRRNSPFSCSAWKVFYHKEQEENQAFQQRLVKAKVYHTLKVERLLFSNWRISSYNLTLSIVWSIVCRLAN